LAKWFVLSKYVKSSYMLTNFLFFIYFLFIIFLTGRGQKGVMIGAIFLSFQSWCVFENHQFKENKKIVSNITQPKIMDKKTSLTLIDINILKFFAIINI
jgi:hypothetical protein